MDEALAGLETKRQRLAKLEASGAGDSDKAKRVRVNIQSLEEVLKAQNELDTVLRLARAEEAGSQAVCRGASMPDPFARPKRLSKSKVAPEGISTA